MDDGRFYGRLNEASQLLTREAGGPPPGRSDADSAREILSELEDDPLTAGDLEREAALDAVHRQLSVLSSLLRHHDSPP
jgi:hypothetical protein